MTETCFGVGGVDQAREDTTINVKRIVARFMVVTRYFMDDFILVVLVKLKKNAAGPVMFVLSER